MADCISYLLQAHVSLVRVETFLREPETDKYSQLAGNSSSAIGFEDATFSWPGNAAAQESNQERNETSVNRFHLEGLNVRFKEGSLNVVSGVRQVTFLEQNQSVYLEYGTNLCA